MSKKNADREKEEEKDLEEDEDEDEAEEEEEEEERPAAAKAARRERAHHAHDDHHDDDDEEASDEDDPYWWTPHAVLSALVLFGVLGFFGVFNAAASKIPFLAHPGGAVAANEKPAEKAPAAVNPAKPADQREEFGAKHLLVQYKGAMRAPASITRTEDEAKARATEAMKKAKSGTKFEELVKEYSDEPNAAQRGGDLGKFKKGQMVPEFQNAVEKLKVGEVSDLVKTPFGYHVILRTQ